MNTERPDEPSVRLEYSGKSVAILTLNRPKAHNAINAAMAKAIENIVEEVEANDSIRVAIITAEGPSFCAGADLKEVAAGGGSSLVRPKNGFAGFVFASKRKPWIAALQGSAYGGGTEIALACDMIVAANTVRMGLPEVKVGLMAGAGGAFRLARAIPRALAIETITTGVPISAERAYQLGLVNRLVEREQVLPEAISLAELIAANSPLAVRESLLVAKTAADGDQEKFRSVQDEASIRVMEGPDFMEGAKAFSEKRSPVWRT